MEPQAGLEDIASTADDADVLLAYCPMHPGVQTRLRCGKCGQPICPRCLVYTPVGARCRPCANLKPLPQYQVDAELYLRGIAVAVGAAVVLGIAWAYVYTAVPYLYLWPAALVGVGAGEAISRAANRRRSRGLQVIAGLCVLGAFLVQGVVVTLLGDPSLPVSAEAVVELASDELAVLSRDAFGVLIVGLGVYMAIGRL